MEREPRVSVVTPFYNTADYLAECIEGVLAQTHTNFEYVLVNNKSTDGSREIALAYAGKDPRIRFFDNETFVGQLQNYNGALGRISPESKYVKMASADDILFPECLARMVELGEREPSAGLVGAYYLEGRVPAGGGVPYPTQCSSGREICRLRLLTGSFPLGTPTTVLYRADVVRSRQPFYPVDRYHGDTEIAFEILLEHDFGFVHQVLSFVRAENVSITSSRQGFHPNLLDHFILAERFGSRVLDEEELRLVRARVSREYYQFLGRAVLRFKSRSFWDYHRSGLATLGRELRWREVLPRTATELLRLALEPKNTLERGIGDLWKRYRGIAHRRR